jgi:hypothetical protein
LAAWFIGKPPRVERPARAKEAFRLTAPAMYQR